MSDVYERLQLRRVVNGAGTLTAYGQSSALPEAIAAVGEALPLFFEMDVLHARASAVIARVLGAEAGFVTCSAAAGITIGTAAFLAGTDPARIERLPETDGRPSEAVIPMAHCVDYGAPITQGLRLAGARVRTVGTVNGCPRHLLAASLSERTALAVYVVSHHTVQHGGIPLSAFIATAHERGVPVLVDAAAEETQLREILALGADLVVCSGHKHFRGPTTGVMAGTLPAIRAAYAQNRGIGRHMKVGKEGIIGLIAALEYWERHDRDAELQRERTRLERLIAGLAGLPGLTASLLFPEPDPLPIYRAKLSIDPAASGLSALALVALLARRDPSIRVRGHHADEGYFLIDPFTLTDDDADLIAAAIRDELSCPADEKAALLRTFENLSFADLWTRPTTWPEL